MSADSPKETVMKGLPASPGVAHAPAFPFSNGDLDVPCYSVPPEKQEEEITRFEQGLLETRRQISAIRAEVEEKVGEDEASIFDAHQLVLEDRALIEETIKEVTEQKLNIEYCFQQVANRYIEAFTQIDDAYIKERVADIKDVTRRLICNLLGHDHCSHEILESDRILLTRDLTPSETAMLEVDRVRGIVTEQGSRTSHSVIMARSFGIPCVVGIHGILEKVTIQDQILVDGFKGLVIINPNNETLERYGRLQVKRLHIQEKFDEEKLDPSFSLDNKQIHLLLNIEGLESESRLKESGAEGVGLFRTENLFLNASHFPDEEFQFDNYRTLVERMNPHPVTIRTLDLGGDKNPHRSLMGYQEANPFMGFRAIRFCLENRDVFKDQLRAILRASAYGKIKVLYPMISSCQELVNANELLEECKEELRKRGQDFDENIQRGSMIEVPSAAVITDLLAEHSDFFSIGTNDLIQYMLAVDRVNDRIAHLYEPAHPAIMRTLSFIFESGKRRNVPVSVCGELAGDPLYAPLLLGMGASELSVAWGAVPEIKYLIRRMSIREARKMVVRVLRSNNPEAIRSELESFYREIMGSFIMSYEDDEVEELS